MKKNGQNTIKEYESEEGQKMKVSEELDDQIINSNYSPNMKIVYSLIALIITIIVIIILKDIIIFMEETWELFINQN